MPTLSVLKFAELRSTRVAFPLARTPPEPAHPGQHGQPAENRHRGGRLRHRHKQRDGVPARGLEGRGQRIIKVADEELVAALREGRVVRQVGKRAAVQVDALVQD